MGKRRIKTIPEKNKPVIKELDAKKFWITGISIAIGIILLVFIINYQSIPYWFGKTDPVAKVNGEPIYSAEAKSDLIFSDITYKSVLGGSMLINGNPNDIHDFKSAALDDLIKSHIQLQEAKKEGIKLTDKEMAYAVNTFNKSFESMLNANSDDIKTDLNNYSLTQADLKKYGKQSSINNNIINKLKQNVIKKDYVKTLTNKDIESITVREIWISLQNRTQVQAKKLIDEIYAKLQSGAKFNDLVKEYKKVDFNAENNGLIGTINRGIMPEEFDKVAFSLKPGQVSAPVKTKLGYHIILVDKHNNDTVDNLNQGVIDNIMTSDKFNAYYDSKVNKWYKKASKHKFVVDFK